jgi:hypothetical protein
MLNLYLPKNFEFCQPDYSKLGNHRNFVSIIVMFVVYSLRLSYYCRHYFKSSKSTQRQNFKGRRRRTGLGEWQQLNYVVVRVLRYIFLLEMASSPYFGDRKHAKAHSRISTHGVLSKVLRFVYSICAGASSVIAYLRDERYKSLFDTLGVDSKAVQFGWPRVVAGERQTIASRGIERGSGSC